jgi:hypothetical protein
MTGGATSTRLAASYSRVIPMNKDKTIKLLGVLFIAVGSLQTFLRAKDIWWLLTFLFRPNAYSTVHNYLFYSAASLFFFIILPLAILVAGIGVIRIKRWGWILAITVCAVTFIVKLIGTMNFEFAVYRLKDHPIPPITEGAVVGYVSMWPTYIYGIASGLLILVLTRNSIKKAFHN